MYQRLYCSSSFRYLTVNDFTLGFGREDTDAPAELRKVVPCILWLTSGVSLRHTGPLG
jgi:hypothetical protein